MVGKLCCIMLLVVLVVAIELLIIFLCSGEVDVEVEGIEGLGVIILLLFDNKRLFVTGVLIVFVFIVSFLFFFVI